MRASSKKGGHSTTKIDQFAAISASYDMYFLGGISPITYDQLESDVNTAEANAVGERDVVYMLPFQRKEERHFKGLIVLVVF